MNGFMCIPVWERFILNASQRNLRHKSSWSGIFTHRSIHRPLLNGFVVNRQQKGLQYKHTNKGFYISRFRYNSLWNGLFSTPLLQSPNTNAAKSCLCMNGFLCILVRERFILNTSQWNLSDKSSWSGIFTYRSIHRPLLNGFVVNPQQKGI